MNPQEMASEERKAADAKIEEDNLFLSLGAADQQAETDAFQCGRCKQVGQLLTAVFIGSHGFHFSYIRGNVVIAKLRLGALMNQ
jgi:hypothetical protein